MRLHVLFDESNGEFEAAVYKKGVFSRIAFATVDSMVFHVIESGPDGIVPARSVILAKEAVFSCKDFFCRDETAFFEEVF